MRLALIALCASASLAHADAKHDRQVIADLDAAYAPSAKLAGADRTKQACSDAGKLQSAAAALPQKHAPAGAAVDDETWRSAANGLISELEDLVAVCKTPDHKLTHIGNRVETADQIVATVDGLVRTALDVAKQRALPPALKKLGKTLAAIQPASKQVCNQDKQLAKLATGLAAPAGADTAKWQAASAQLAHGIDELKQFACGSPRGADEEISGSLQVLHDAYMQLVLASPAS